MSFDMTDSQTDHSVDQHVIAENTDRNNESQSANNDHVKSPAVCQPKVNVRGTSPTVTGKDETRGIIGKFVISVLKLRALE
jgi:hypothetical protein